MEQVYRVYKVIKPTESLLVGDEVVLIDDIDGDMVIVNKITLARKDGVLKTDDKKSYWFSSPHWVHSASLVYDRVE